VGSSDPYAKVYLLQPNGSALFQKGHEQTKTFKNMLNLNFEDEFQFTVSSRGGGAGNRETYKKMLN
jgi:hypothetical protein